MDREYYLLRKTAILALFDTHAQAWRPFLVSHLSPTFSSADSGGYDKQKRPGQEISGAPLKKSAVGFTPPEDLKDYYVGAIAEIEDM